MATKKIASKKAAKKSARKRNIFADDPPIIVGGGSSTYIWILKSYSPPTLEANPNPQYQIDTNKYDCYDVGVNLGSYETHDGVGQGSPHAIKNRRMHRTKFFKAQRKRK
jgi:hypothetical protein